MNSHDLKSSMLWHLLYRLQYVAVLTEYGSEGCIGNADVFAINKKGHTTEVEVKVSKSDLEGELRSIRALVENVNLFTNGERPNVSKYSKHRQYLQGSHSTYWGNRNRPNRFYYAVTGDLQAHALETLEKTPYGLFVIDSQGATCIRRAKFLHDDKVTDEIRDRVMHKMCSEVVILREEKARGLRCTGCSDPISTICIKCRDKREANRRITRELKQEALTSLA